MLSLLPAMLHRPMDELTPALPLRIEIRRALEGNANPERSLLQWLECQEYGDWAGCDAVAEAIGLNEAQSVGCFAEAVEWAEEALRSVA
jgi:c-di-GMP-related signal transduction protein